MRPTAPCGEAPGVFWDRGKIGGPECGEGWGQARHRVWQQVEAKTVAVFSPEPTRSCQAQADDSAPPQCDAVKNGSGRGWRVTTFPLPGALGLSRRCV